MVEKIDSHDAKTKLPEILRRVEAGESFTITNRGKPIADLSPTQAKSRLEVQAAINNLLKIKKPTVSDADLEAMRREGQR